MILAAFYFGPYDGVRMVLPTEVPWPKFVIPEFGTVQLEWFYLLAGQMDENTWSYLFDDSYAGLTTSS